MKTAEQLWMGKNVNPAENSWKQWKSWKNSSTAEKQLKIAKTEKVKTDEIPKIAEKLKNPIY